VPAAITAVEVAAAALMAVAAGAAAPLMVVAADRHRTPIAKP